MRLVANPAGFDVIVTENMFGDILTDEAAVLVGLDGPAALGLAGQRRAPGCTSPSTAPRRISPGKGIANPCGTMLSAAMLLRYSLGLEAEARAIEAAVERAIDAGALTRDLGGSLGTARDDRRDRR